MYISPIGPYLLGLLAMIKCSICSYQCDNWYVSNWRLACHIYFSVGRVSWACSESLMCCTSIAHCWAQHTLWGNDITGVCLLDNCCKHSKGLVPMQENSHEVKACWGPPSKHTTVPMTKYQNAFGCWFLVQARFSFTSYYGSSYAKVSTFLDVTTYVLKW